MGDYNSTPITQLQPGAIVLPTDVYAAVDVTDFAQSPSGSTKKYTVGQLQAHFEAWFDVTVGPALMVPSTGYLADTGALTLLELPTVISVGQQIQIASRGTSTFKILQGANQQIFIGASGTTAGVLGYIESTTLGASITLVCTKVDTAMSPHFIEFHALNAPQGTFTVA